MKTLVLLLVICIGGSLHASSKILSSELERIERFQDSLEMARKEVDRLDNQQSILKSRIDQLERVGDNYRIEKDLLKETFSSNYLYLTMLLAAVGGVFTLLTFLGFKDARATKREFQEELVELRDQLAQARHSAQEFEKRRLQYEEEFSGLLKKYEQQNKRLEVQDKRLEVVEWMEKAHNILLGNGNAQFALDYALKALELAPERGDVLRLVASCLNRLNRCEEALSYLEKAYSISSEETIGDLLECRAFLNRFEGLEPLVEKHKTTLERVSRLGGGFVFLAFRHYYKNDLAALIKHVDETINAPHNAKKTGKKFNWGSIEAIQVASYLPQSPIQSLLLSYMGWCEGQVALDDLNGLLRSIREIQK